MHAPPRTAGGAGRSGAGSVRQCPSRDAAERAQGQPSAAAAICPQRGLGMGHALRRLLGSRLLQLQRVQAGPAGAVAAGRCAPGSMPGSGAALVLWVWAAGVGRAVGILAAGEPPMHCHRSQEPASQHRGTEAPTLARSKARAHQQHEADCMHVAAPRRQLLTSAAALAQCGTLPAWPTTPAMPGVHHPSGLHAPATRASARRLTGRREGGSVHVTPCAIRFVSAVSHLRLWAPAGWLRPVRQASLAAGTLARRRCFGSLHAVVR